jgi:hypothetical protein
MITSIRSPSQNTRRSIVPARTNTRQLAQILFSSDNRSLLPPLQRTIVVKLLKVLLPEAR